MLMQLQNGSQRLLQSCPQCLRCKVLGFFPPQTHIFSQVPLTLTVKRSPCPWEASRATGVIAQQEEDGWMKAIKFPTAAIGSADWK